MRLLHEIAIFQTVKSKVRISLFETVRLSVSISLRNLNYSLNSIKERIIAPVLRIDNQQNFKIMKILILLKSIISLFYIIRYILRSMM